MVPYGKLFTELEELNLCSWHIIPLFLKSKYFSDVISNNQEGRGLVLYEGQQNRWKD